MTEGGPRLETLRSGVRVVLLAGAFWVLLGFSNERAPSALPRPSVLLITLDTLRADHLGCYGYKRIKTPAIDQLAAEGLLFRHAYAQVPITLPSHAVILTGTYPMYNGVRDFTSSGLPEEVPTLAEILRRNGYQTAAFVSSFVLNSLWGLNRGFEVYDDNVGLDLKRARDFFMLERRGDRTVGSMLEWLGHRQAGKPFFIWLHLYDPHSPYHPPEPYLSQYASHPYDGEIAFDDAQVGRVIAQLRALNLYQDTLVMLLSDHGESLGEHGEAEHGFFVYNTTLHVPLIVKLPRRTAESRVITQPVGTVDVAPTIAQICKIPSEQTRSFQGQSLFRASDKASASEAHAVYAESFYPRNSFGWHELRALVTPQFKFIEAPRGELYELERDPGERENVIDRSSATAASLRHQLANEERQFQGRGVASPAPLLDPETLEKLRSLGYVSYQAERSANVPDEQRPDPKDKINTLNRILRASDLTRLGRFTEADLLLGQLEQAEPGLYVIPFQRGENFLAWGKPRPALKEFEKSLTHNPSFDQAALGLGRAHFLLEQDEQAAKALELALHLNPRNFLARLTLGKVYWRGNRLEKAEAELEEVAKTHPDFPQGHADYGVVLAKLGKYQDALAEIQQGLEMGYRDAIAYDYLGISFAHTGDLARAIEAYEQAVKLDPRYAAACLNLALAWKKQGELAKAQMYYRKACELSEDLCREYASQFQKH